MATRGLVVIAMLGGCALGVGDGPGTLAGGPELAPGATTELDASGSDDSGSSTAELRRDAPDAESTSGSTDTGAPAEAPCGNGTIDDDEECDGDVGSHTCAMWGFLAGELACTADCTIDTTACIDGLVCGDGVIAGDEQCEHPIADTCQSLDLGGGALACTSCRYDADDCTCRGHGQHCHSGWDGESNCCPAGFKGNVRGVCDAQARRCE